MRKLFLFVMSCSLAVMIVGVSVANADVVYLKDGGAIAGTSSPSTEEDKIIFKTAYGELVIPKSLILHIEYGTFDITGSKGSQGGLRQSKPFPLKFVASPDLGLGFAGGGNLETAKTGFWVGGDFGLDILRWLSLRLSAGTGKFGTYSTGGTFGFSSESEVRATSVLLDALYTLRFGKTAFDVGLGPGIYVTSSRTPYTYYYNNTYWTYEQKNKATKFGGHVTLAYRFFLKDKMSIDLRNRFHALNGGITWLEGATAGLSFYF